MSITCTHTSVLIAAAVIQAAFLLTKSKSIHWVNENKLNACLDQTVKNVTKSSGIFGRRLLLSVCFAAFGRWPLMNSLYLMSPRATFHSSSRLVPDRRASLSSYICLRFTTKLGISISLQSQSSSSFYWLKVLGTMRLLEGSICNWNCPLGISSQGVWPGACFRTGLQGSDLPQYPSDIRHRHLSGCDLDIHHVPTWCMPKSQTILLATLAKGHPECLFPRPWMPHQVP